MGAASAIGKNNTIPPLQQANHTGNYDNEPRVPKLTLLTSLFGHTPLPASWPTKATSWLPIFKLKFIDE